MYHDEFAKKSARPRPKVEEPGSSLPMEVGGGLSLGLAASLNPPISILVFYLGGLLPLVACSAEIAARRVAESLSSLIRSLPGRRPAALPVTHLTGPHRRPQGAGTTRVGAGGLHRLGR
jgi:hypothetical protein